MLAQAGPVDGWGESESCVRITGMFEQELVFVLSGIRGLMSVRHGLTLAGDFVGGKDTLACAHHKLENGFQSLIQSAVSIPHPGTGAKYIKMEITEVSSLISEEKGRLNRC